MPHKKKESNTIQSIDELSKVFIETLKEISSSGKGFSLNELSRLLKKREGVQKLISLASSNVGKTTETVSEDELKGLKKRLAYAVEERKKIHRQFVDIDDQFENEKDFQKRFLITILGMCHTTGNEAHFDLLNQYKQLVMEDAELENREQVLTSIKKSLLKSDTGKKGDDKTGRSKSFERSIVKESTPDILQELKKAFQENLEKLRSVLGDDYSPDLVKVIQRINESDDVSYLISQRAKILAVIERFAEQTRSERDRITRFIREIGEKLVTLEQELDTSSAATLKRQKENVDFHENLHSEIEVISDTIENSDDFESLESMVMLRLKKISSAVVKKRDEFLDRLKETELEREKIHTDFEDVIQELEKEKKIIEEQARTDPLTGIFNKRVFGECIEIEFERYKRYLKPFSLIFFDIDNFKKVNDTYGHEAGDRALKGITISAGQALRKTDILARYGGEEFVVILPETDIKHGVNVAKKLHKLIENTVFDYEGQNVSITISVGITEVRETDSSTDSVVKRADKFMYCAKEKGRNSVVSDLDVDE